MQDVKKAHGETIIIKCLATQEEERIGTGSK